MFSLLLASSTAFADLNYNLPLGVTSGSQDIYHLHMTVFWICVAIAIPVFGIMFYSILFHRKSRGKKPAKFHEHLWVEIIWTVIPLLILIGLAIPGTKVLLSLNDVAKPDLTIKVTGYQWKWRYEYLNHGIQFFSNLSTPYDQRIGKAPKDATYLQAVDNPLVIPTHKKVRFVITSNDVIHSWFVPALGVKRDGVPGFINEVWARVDRPGIYYGQCAQLCGLNHAFMPIVVEAKNEKEFNEWLIKKGGTVQDTSLPQTAASAPQSSGSASIVSTPIPATPTTAASLSTPASESSAQSAASTTLTASPGAKSSAVPTATQTPISTEAKPKTLSKEELMKKGEPLYQSVCAACHQPNGEGMPPLYPALKGSAIVNGPVAAHIDVVLNGKPGTAMQAFRDQQTDEDLAAIITYERNAWDNSAKDVVQADQIKTAKQQRPN